MPRFMQVITGKSGKERRRSQAHRYGQYNANGSHTSHMTPCLKCKHRLPCTVHGAGGKSSEDDAERLYIHKTISIEMMSHKSDQELVDPKETQDVFPYPKNGQYPDDEIQIGGVTLAR